MSWGQFNMEQTLDFEKVIFLLKNICSDPNLSRTWLKDLVDNSKFSFEAETKYLLARPFPGYKVTLFTEPEVYQKNFKELKTIKDILIKDIHNLTDSSIHEIKILSDYSRLEVYNSEIRPVVTEWQELNKAQNQIIEQLKKSHNALDIKNIGNSARHILQQTASIVFNVEKHTPLDKKIDVSSEKYKNQLHSYIKAELVGDSCLELRKFAEAAIDMAENSIDLANAVTHRTETEKTVAEVCVMGTITVISIVNFIEKR
jgi:hypothetical protein